MTATAQPRPSVERSTGLMVVGTLLSRLTGFGRNVALAYAIGQNALTDAYNVANTTPNIVYELILGGVLSATLVPLFVAQLRPRSDGSDPPDPWHDVSAVLTLVVAVAVAVGVAFLIAAPHLIDLYLSADAGADQRAVATRLLRLFAPQILCYGVITVTTAILDARRRFGPSKFAPIANNVIVIGVLLAVPHVADDLAVSRIRDDTAALLFLGLGTTAGVAGMAIAQVAFLRSAGARLRPVWAPRSPLIRRLLRLSLWTLGVVVLNQVALWVVLKLATSREGDQSAYAAALVFFQLPYGVYAVSVMSALAPEMADHWLNGDLDGLGRRVVTGLRRTLAIIAPAGVGLAVVASPLVIAILQHGRFDARDADVTASTLVCLAVGLPGFSAFLLFGRVLQSMQDTRTMFWLYVVENGVNVATAIPLHDRLGIEGLALSYSLAYSVAAVVAFAVLHRRLPAGWAAGLTGWLIRVGAVTGLVGGAAAGGSALVAWLLGSATSAPSAFLQLVVAVPSGGIALIIAASVLGVREPGELTAPILRRVGLTRRRSKGSSP